MKSTMLNGEQLVPQRQIVKTGRYLERFFVNEMPLDSCLPTLGLTLRTQPYLQGRLTKHLLALYLFSFLSVSTLIWYCHSLMSR